MPGQEVPVFEGVTKEIFINEIYPKRQPALLRGLPLGSAVNLWTPEYLARTVGDRQVKVHVCPTEKMDFLSKNFAYKSLPFAGLVHRTSGCQTDSSFFISPNEKYYLRALGDDPRKDCADFEQQYPEIAADLNLPEFFPREKFFSSVLRLGSPGIQLWTHYDVMDNVLVEVVGRKRIILFPPQDAFNLYLSTDKSPVLDPDSPDLGTYPDFAKAEQWRCMLSPGEVLFIPALWSHNVLALDFSVAVNVFWRHLDAEVYERRDPYGNKDPVAAGRALQGLERAMQCLAELPDEYCDFYARRMMARLRDKCCKRS